MKDKNSLVAVDCTFIFDQSSSYSKYYEFEYALMDFFYARGLNLERVKGISGANGRQMYIITKIEKLGPPAVPQPKKGPQPLTNQQKILQKRK